MNSNKVEKEEVKIETNEKDIKYVTFNILNKNQKKIKLEENKKVKDVRKHILELYDIKDKYCKLEFVLEYPIRKFGILTLYPGELTDVYDEERLNRFNIVDKTVDINVYFVEKKVKREKRNYKKFRYNNSVIERKKEKKVFVFNESDFPALS